VDLLLSDPSIAAYRSRIAPEFITVIIREVVNEAREDLAAGKRPPVSLDYVKQVTKRLDAILSPSLKRVVNATGVVLHTGLGRAPLSKYAIDAIVTAAGYCNLEFDLKTGNRGDRQVHVERLLQLLTGAEAAMVVNNNAAAVYLTLSALAFSKEVIVSRGQLIEIGGSFRLPDIMRRAGVKLVEVGATNRTRIDDYRTAITDKTALILRAYPSNYRIDGFTESASIPELVALGKEFSIPVVDDLGGGLLWDWSNLGLPSEPTVQESITAGVDLTLVSGDKVIGGSQSGIILGRKDLVAKLKKNALARVIRADKLAIAALSATLRSFLNRQAVTQQVPTWKLLASSQDEMSKRAERLMFRLKPLTAWQILEIRDTASEAGSGTLPAVAIPSIGICLVPGTMNLSAFTKQLRLASCPVIGTVRQDSFWLDMRTISDDDEDLLVSSMAEVLKSK
jgi:L-seryl-tRNA(Ser) seleniumtransferase